MRKIDYIIVIGCIITLFVAGYDLYILEQTEQRCLDDCNIYWQNFVEENCKQNNGNIIVPNLLNYTY